MSTLFPNLLSVYNEALLSCGEKAITDTDNSAFAAVYRGVAENVARRQLASYHWDFARKEEKLVRIGTDLNDQHVYTIPADCLKIRRIHVNDCRLRDFKVLRKSIVSRTESDDLILDYTYAADVSLWSPDFYDALRVYYEGLIRKSVLMDIADGNRDMDMARAMFIEAQAREFNSTGNRVRNDGGSVLAARQGFGRHGG